MATRVTHLEVCIQYVEDLEEAKTHKMKLMFSLLEAAVPIPDCEKH